MKCFYFGCWNEPGHYLFGSGGRKVPREDYAVEYYYGGSNRREHLDGSLAPADHPYTGKLCFLGGLTDAEHNRVRYKLTERPQGQFLLHVLTNGCTAISWWDRTQGDRRSACNSTVLLEGTHTADEMLAALAEHFPSILAHLKAAGVELVDVTAELNK